jgi:predicted porin
MAMVALGDENARKAMRTKYRYAAIPEGSGTTLSVAYEHYLSKRTTVYASYGQVENTETGIVPMLGAATAVFPTTLGDDIRVLSLGLRHVF